MRNAGLEEAQAGIKIDRRKINNDIVNLNNTVNQPQISITSDMQMTPSLWQKVKRN